jgi:predicted Zn-dependent protease
MKILGQGPAITAIESIGARLTRESRYHYRWYAAQSSELNAFALPGGIVVVTTGLIKATNLPEELAGVIAHEVAHAEKRHGLQSLVKSMGLSVAFRIILGQFDPNSRAVAQHFTELKFSRDAEREADREGLRLLLRARIAPEGMVRIFEKLEQQSVLTTNVPPTFLSSHPALPERLEWLRAELRKPHEPSIPLNMDYAALRAATN